MAVEDLKTKTHEVAAVLAVFEVNVKMNEHSVVVVCLVLAATTAAVVKVGVRLAVVVVHASVKRLRTKIRLVVVILAMNRVAIMRTKDTVIEIGLTLASMVAASVPGVVQMVHIVVQAVFKQTKTESCLQVASSMMARVAVGSSRCRRRRK